jgi:hypothetical protein
MAAAERDRRLIAALREQGLKYPRTTLRESQRVGLELSFALAFLDKETRGKDVDGAPRFGLNLFGNDPVRNPVKGGFVTPERYRRYLINRRRGLGMQGVGPLQLTWWEFQDMADRLGGCWKPGPNLRVGFAIAKRLIRDHGKLGGASRWNGTGDAADRYGRDWLARQRFWHEFLAARSPEPGITRIRLIRLTTPYERGRHVARLQHALNDRLRSRHLSEITVDGEYGPTTAAAVRQVGYLLGALEATLDRGATIALQKIIIDPTIRDAKQRARAKRRAVAAAGTEKVAERVIDWCESKVGMTEQPPGSNRGPEINSWQAEFGNRHGGWPWCGAFVGYALRRIGGLPIGAGVVYTPNILAWARNRTGGFQGFHPWSDRKRGDLVLMRFPGSGPDPVHHVGIYVGDGTTIEGNTAAGTSGSQNNGGGVYRRKRPESVIVGCGRPRYG